MEAKKHIEAALRGACEKAGITEPVVVLEYPAESEHGDFASNVALRHAKALGKTSLELAQEIVDVLNSIGVEGVATAEVAGAGFINIHLTPDAFAGVLKEAQEEWGCNESQKGKKVMVEYTDPNPFKEFHIGHLMSNTIGESIARLIECSGADVKRANYQGDVGLHVAKAIYVYKSDQFRPSDEAVQGNEAARWALSYKIGNDLYESNQEAREEINKINKKVYERSDEDMNALYDTGRTVSLKEFEKIYETLGMELRGEKGTETGVYFDNYFYESETWKVGKKIVEENPKVFPESDGARIFEGEKHGLHTRVFLTTEGLPTYEAKDLGLLRVKKERAEKYGDWKSVPNISIVITGNEQNEYFKVILEAAKTVGGDIAEVANKTTHMGHGMMRFADGKMSSRAGNVITARELLQELIHTAKERAQESRAEDKERLARQIAVAAIKYQVLKQAPGKDIIFDKERALSLEGDSGPYVQYAHARARTLLDDAQKEGIKPHVDAPQTEKEREVARMVMQFPDVVMRAQEDLEPHYVTTYITNLASAYNSWYAHERVLGTEDASRRLAITRAVADTLAHGLQLLGIEAPERV